MGWPSAFSNVGVIVWYDGRPVERAYDHSLAREIKRLCTGERFMDKGNNSQKNDKKSKRAKKDPKKPEIKSSGKRYQA